jgi:hypothetical protein
MGQADRSNTLRILSRIRFIAKSVACRTTPPTRERKNMADSAEGVKSKSSTLGEERMARPFALLLQHVVHRSTPW